MPSHADFRPLTDAEIALIAPVVVFWTLSLIFHLFDEFKLFQNYKLMTEEKAQKNIATRSEVVRTVLLHHAIQLGTGLLTLPWEHTNPKPDDIFGVTSFISKWLIEDNPTMQQHPALASLLYISIFISRQVVALLVMDTWQFWVHYFMHVNTWTYRKLMDFAIERMTVDAIPCPFSRE